MFILMLHLLLPAALALPALRPSLPLSPSRNIVHASYFEGTSSNLAYDLALYSGVVRILSKGADVACSGSLVGRQWVLTAAHCADDQANSKVCFSEGLQKKGLCIGVTHTISESMSEDSDDNFQQKYMALRFNEQNNNQELALKNIDELKHMSVDGIALLHLAQPAPEQMSILELADAEDLKIGQAVVSVGFPGHPITVNAPDWIMPGWHSRVKGMNCHIRDIDDKQKNQANLIFGDCPIGQGDSGGPLLIWTQGQWKIAGVSSGQMNFADHEAAGEPWTFSMSAIWINTSLSRTSILDVVKPKGN